MKKYTVILLYPDYIANDYGETWCETVDAENPIHAVEVAQKQCFDENKCEPHQDYQDFKPVSVFEGAHQDLVGQWAAAQ